MCVCVRLYGKRVGIRGLTRVCVCVCVCACTRRGKEVLGLTGAPHGMSERQCARLRNLADYLLSCHEPGVTSCDLSRSFTNTTLFVDPVTSLSGTLS